MWEELRQNVGTLPAWGVSECRLAAYVLRVEPCFSAESKSGWIRAIGLTELFITAGAIQREPNKKCEPCRYGESGLGNRKGRDTARSQREPEKLCGRSSSELCSARLFRRPSGSSSRHRGAKAPAPKLETLPLR